MASNITDESEDKKYINITGTQNSTYILPHGRSDDFWEQIKTNLVNITTLTDIDGLLDILNNQIQITGYGQYIRYGQELPGLIQAGNIVANYFEDDFHLLTLIQTIATFALEVETLFPISTLKALEQNENGVCEFTRKHIRCLNALGFLGCLPDQAYCDDPYQTVYRKYSIDFVPLFVQTSKVGIHRLACQLSYFYETIHGTFNEDELILYRRRVMTEEPTWNTDTSEFQEVQVFDNVLIEDQPASCQLDFANEKLHIGTIIPSATQEEVVFSIRPECFPAMLMFDTMLHNECIILSNVQRYCCYTGYLHSFQYAGPFTNRMVENPVSVLAIDAVVNIGHKQFRERVLHRDLLKAYCGFSFEGYNDEWISTGMWGCGVFNGDPVLKFLQQMMVAAMSNKKLYYACYLNEHLTETLQNIGNTLQEKGLTVKDVYQLITQFDATVQPFTDYVCSQLQLPGAPQRSQQQESNVDCCVQ